MAVGSTGAAGEATNVDGGAFAGVSGLMSGPVQGAEGGKTGS